MGHIQRERLPKSKMASSDNDRFKVWLEILVANLVTNFLDLVAKVKNLVTLAPVLGAILRPDEVCFSAGWEQIKQKTFFSV